VRVLVVSPDVGERSRATSALPAEVEVVQVTTAPEAHRALERGDVDVLVIDGDLRPEGGYSVLYELRAAGDLEGRRTPPAIVLMDRRDDRFLAEWARADEAVLKPSDPFDLAARVMRLGDGAVASQPSGGASASE